MGGQPTKGRKHGGGEKSNREEKAMRDDTRREGTWERRNEKRRPGEENATDWAEKSKRENEVIGHDTWMEWTGRDETGRERERKRQQLVHTSSSMNDTRIAKPCRCLTMEEFATFSRTQWLYDR